MELGSADPLMLYYLGYKKTAYYYSFLSSFLLYSPKRANKIAKNKINLQFKSAPFEVSAV